MISRHGAPTLPRPPRTIRQAQVQAALIKSRSSIDNFVRLLRMHIGRSRRRTSWTREGA